VTSAVAGIANVTDNVELIAVGLELFRKNACPRAISHAHVPKTLRKSLKD